MDLMLGIPNLGPGRFTEGFGTADLQSAKRLLEELARTETLTLVLINRPGQTGLGWSAKVPSPWRD
jgi:hypothetical protein